MNPSTSKLT